MATQQIYPTFINVFSEVRLWSQFIVIHLDPNTFHGIEMEEIFHNNNDIIQQMRDRLPDESQDGFIKVQLLDTIETQNNGYG